MVTRNFAYEDVSRSYDLVNTLIDGYRLIELIGEGGMGTVYKAVDPDGGTPVAFKIVKPSIANDDLALRRFEREIRVADQLDHPHILPILSISVSEPYTYMVMPFVNNGSLDTFLRYGQLPTPGQAHLVGRQIGSALQYAHEFGIIHRDIKPDNIMLTGTHEVALTDFGLAKFADNAATRLTMTGTVIGTPTYMSPEQALGYPLDWSTDLYTLALVIYRMLLGRLPLSAESPMAMVNQQINSLPIRPSQITPIFPEKLESVLLRALAKDRDERHGSIAEFMSELNDGMDAIDDDTYATGHLVTEEQVESSMMIVPEIASTRVFLVPGVNGEDTDPATPSPTANIPAPEAGRNSRPGWLALALLLTVVGIGVIAGWQRIVRPLEQRAINAELTAQAAGEQTPIVITQMVTNNAGEIIIIEATRLVTAVPEVTEEASAVPATQEPAYQPRAGTATLYATSTPTPTFAPSTSTPEPAQESSSSDSSGDSGGGSSDGGSGDNDSGSSPSDSTNSDSTSQPPDPTQPAAPTDEPVSTDPPPTEVPAGPTATSPGSSGDAPGQDQDDTIGPGSSGDAPGQVKDNDKDNQGNSGSPPGQDKKDNK